MVLVYLLTNHEYEFIKQDCIWFRIFVTDTAHPGGQGIEKTGEVKCLEQISQAMISSSSPLRDRYMEASFFSICLMGYYLISDILKQKQCIYLQKTKYL